MTISPGTSDKMEMIFPLYIAFVMNCSFLGNCEQSRIVTPSKIECEGWIDKYSDKVNGQPLGFCHKTTSLDALLAHCGPNDTILKLKVKTCVTIDHARIIYKEPIQGKIPPLLLAPKPTDKFDTREKF